MKSRNRIIITCLVLSSGLLSFRYVVNDNYFDIIKNIEIFTNVYKALNANYADDVDPNRLMKIGVDAMVNSLDPYTVFYSESTVEKYRYLQEGKYTGIGGKLRKIDDMITITETMEKSPLTVSGLKAGDQISAIQGKSVVGISVNDFMDLLKTYGGQSVTLTVNRTGEDKPLKYELKTGEVEVDNVPYYKMVDGDIGYVILTTFTRNASGNIKNAINSLKKENPDMKGIILDLRNNGGGLLGEAVDICNLFLPEGKLVVSTKGKVREKDQIYSTRNSALEPDLPLAVLINGSSASASEIVSGVVQDYDRGVLIGSRSFGKGLVQNTREIGYNSRLKITISKYYIPSERCIQGVEYEDGTPVDIPDSLRTQYKTKNGRIVLDGGGVKPDIIMTEEPETELLRALKKQNVFLKYINEYVAQNDSIVDAELFTYTDDAGFQEYLLRTNFTYEHSHEKKLKTILEGAINETEKTAVQEALAAINTFKSQELEEAMPAIRSILEEEIASRYYYERGRVAVSLRNDAEVNQAVSILKDQDQYNKILGNQ